MKKIMHELKRFRWVYLTTALNIGWQHTKTAYKVMCEVKWKTQDDCFVFHATAIVDKRSAEAKEKTKNIENIPGQCNCPNCKMGRKIQEGEGKPMFH